jgi:hypothetical protein
MHPLHTTEEEGNRVAGLSGLSGTESCRSVTLTWKNRSGGKYISWNGPPGPFGVFSGARCVFSIEWHRHSKILIFLMIPSSMVGCHTTGTSGTLSWLLV